MNAHDPQMTEGATKAARLFLTGTGQADTHAKALSDGRPNLHPMAGQPYEGITGKQIAEMIGDPPSVPKDRARWFIPSDYLGADGRSHEAQRERGRFHWLALDVDSNNLDLGDVLGALKAVVPGARLLIYSSRSATADNRKWRALVPLKEPVPGADYQATQEAFFDLLEEASQGTLIPDRALARPGQLVYLPNRGAFYERHHERGAPLLLTAEHGIIQRRETVAAAEREAEEERQPRAERRRARSETSPVDAFNAAHDVAVTLARYGYTRRPGKGGRDWRSPYQTTPGGYATRCFGDCWVSLSASDAGNGLGAATKSGARFGDAFDLFAHFEHGGDFKAAVRAYVAEAGLDRQHRTEGAQGGDGALRRPLTGNRARAWNC